jgi:hypothetical protein
MNPEEETKVEGEMEAPVAEEMPAEETTEEAAA